MNGGFHLCREESSPEQYIGLTVEYWCLFCEIKLFLSQVLADFLEVSMIGDLRIVEFQPGPFNLIVITSLQFPSAGWALRFISPSKFLGVGRLSVMLLPLLRIHCWVWFFVSRQFLAARWNTTLMLDHSNLAEDLSSHSGGSSTPNSWVSVLPLPNLFQKYFPELSWTWHSPFCLKEGGCRKTSRKFMMFNKRRRWFHLITRRTLFGQHVSELVFGVWSTCPQVSTNLIWILRSKLILSNVQSKANLWVLDTCLIVRLLPLMIILITASYSSKMYNWDSPWEKLRLWWRSPHAIIDQHLSFPFCLGLDLWSREQFSCCGVGWCFGTVRWT